MTILKDKTIQNTIKNKFLYMHKFIYYIYFLMTYVIVELNGGQYLMLIKSGY